jgi:multidrug resistance efflux pump
LETTFPRTLRSLRGERSGLALAVPATAAALLVCWSLWFTLAPVELWVATPSARLEVEASARRVAALGPGRIARLHVALGDEVAAGDVLFELEAEDARLELEVARARMPALEDGRKALLREIAAEQERIEALGAAAMAERAELDAMIRRAQAAAATARDEADRLGRLQAQGLVADAHGLRLSNLAAGEQSQCEALQHQRDRRAIEVADRTHEVRSRVEERGGDLARLEGELATTRASIQRLEQECSERRVRAPVAGRVAALSERRPGDVVGAGEELAVVLPPGEMRVVADFPVAQAAGRVAVGQRARMRLDGFPWTEHGSLDARVSAVADEPAGTALRVELTPVDPQSFAVRLRHGMTGSVEVFVEEASPLELVVRAIGRRLEHGRQGAGP